MRKINLLLVCSIIIMLFAQSCKKNETPLKLPEKESDKTITGIPTGFLTGTIPTGTYKIMSLVTTTDPITNKYIGVAGASLSNNAKIEQREFAGNAQRWRITHLGNNEYLLINLNSGKALDLPAGVTTEGIQLEQYAPLLGNPQKWIIEYQGAFGVYRIKSKVNTAKGLHVEGASSANGAKITLNTFAGSGAMQGAGYFFFYPETAFPAPVTIHTPIATKKDVYPRVIRLSNGNLLASFTERDTSVFATDNITKIYRSTNGGTSWTFVSDMTDTQRGLGLNDPEIFELPVAMGSMPAGTLLAGVRSMDFLSANFIDLYKSTNGGTSWTFVSNIATGNGWQHNVYEPFFLIDNSGRLLCYYSDERDAAHSQKLAYRASTNGGATWGAQVDVVALSPQNARPGMVRIAKMGNNQYIMTYEYVNSPNCCSRVYFKTSADGFNWGTVTNAGTLITAIDGSAPGGTPSVLWTSNGSPQGTLIVTSVFNVNPGSPQGSDNYVNFNYGAGSWYRVKQPLPYSPGLDGGAGYSRCIGQSSDGKTLYHINCVDFSIRNNKTMFVATPAW